MFLRMAGRVDRMSAGTGAAATAHLPSRRQRRGCPPSRRECGHDGGGGGQTRSDRTMPNGPERSQTARTKPNGPNEAKRPERSQVRDANRLDRGAAAQIKAGKSNDVSGSPPRPARDQFWQRDPTGITAAESAAYSPPGRIGGWNARPVSQGKKIQVSCDTSVMKVSTSGRPIGFA